jgi:hypothetical protein
MHKRLDVVLHISGVFFHACLRIASIFERRFGSKRRAWHLWFARINQAWASLP